MHDKDDDPNENPKETKEKLLDSLLNYECEEDDDGIDWET